MQWILSVFARNFNQHFNLKGHIWYDRFKSIVIRSFRQLIAAFKYICNNPMKAGMVEEAEDYTYGALWFMKHRRFEIVEPPDPLITGFLPEYFGQALLTE